MSHRRVELSDGWVFKQQDDQSDEWLPVAKFPSQIHMDLLANEKIPDPYVDFNERAVQWVGEKAWVYRVSFPTPEQPSQGAFTTDLVFEGLDTFATVFLNGIEVLKTDNMFVTYRSNVTEHLRDVSQDNVLEIVFDPALLRGRELVKEHSHEHNFLVRQTEAGRLPTRKAQYNWGWDWGPILMTAGPWKPVFLEQYEARIADVWVQSQVDPDLGECSGRVFAEIGGELGIGDKLLVSLSKGGKTVHEKEIVLSSQDSHKPFQTPFKLPNPELWYPLGYGPQIRYDLTAKLIRGGQVISSQSKKIGLRRTQLIQEPDTHGKSFYFRINNVDVFSGGSCWIPTDSFQSQISEKRYRDWIALMAEGNQVMIRIWGGGVYEHDTLLDACDEMGVMVFHDFQFACGSYPAYDSFLKNFEVEARQQIRRLRTHPSVVIWAGNNEDYQVQERYKLDYNYEEDKDPESWLKSTFPARYIYEYLLPKLVKEEDPHMLYHPSSPWGDGKPTADPSVGDIHQWNLWHGAMNKYQEVQTLGGRFISEFGMEAYPHLATLHRMVSDPSQRFPGSMAMDFHNKAIGHERRMMTYVVENFRLGPNAFDLAVYTHLTQIVQAETMRYAYKTWRRDWQDRRCGGVLVWQLNDCWPTVSWAVVDYYLIRKPAFYAISRALRPLDVVVMRTVHDWTQTGDFVDENSGLKTGQVDQTLRARRGTFDVWIASSKLQDIVASVTIRFISVGSGKEASEAITREVTSSPNTTSTVIQGQLCPPSIPNPENIIKPFDMAKYDPYVIHVTLSVNGHVVASDSAWPEPIKFLDLADRGVSFDILSPSQILVKAMRPVKGLVFEEMEGLKLSDNGFDVMPGEEISVKVEGCLPADKLKYTYIGAPGASLTVS